MNVEKTGFRGGRNHTGVIGFVSEVDEIDAFVGTIVIRCEESGSGGESERLEGEGKWIGRKNGASTGNGSGSAKRRRKWKGEGKEGKKESEKKRKKRSRDTTRNEKRRRHDEGVRELMDSDLSPSH